MKDVCSVFGTPKRKRKRNLKEINKNLTKKILILKHRWLKACSKIVSLLPEKIEINQIKC